MPTNDLGLKFYGVCITIRVLSRQHDGGVCPQILSNPTYEPLKSVELEYGAELPLVLALAADAMLANCQGPKGVRGEAAKKLITSAVVAPCEGPAIGQHVVAGDRVTIAVAGAVWQSAEIVSAVVEQLILAGVNDDDIIVLSAPPLEISTSDPGVTQRTDTAHPDATKKVARKSRAKNASVKSVVFDATIDAETACLATDEEGRRLYLSRSLVDADVVIGIGEWSWNAALGGRSLEGELWPTFSRRSSQRELTRTLAKRGRHALADWRSSMQASSWQLGLAASVRVVAGRGNSLAAAAFGLPDSAARQACVKAAAWSPQIAGEAALTVASLGSLQDGFAAVTRAVAASARITSPIGTICLVSCWATPPGVIFLRWRQGVPLEALVHEAIGTGDPNLISEALQTRLFARALGERRLVLLSQLDEGLVEEMEFTFAASGEEVQRLAHRCESVVVLHEADRMLPQTSDADDRV